MAAATLDGRPVAITTSDDGTARVWDPATGQATATLTGHTRGVTGVAASRSRAPASAGRALVAVVGVGIRHAEALPLG